jgi:hypothetical protein
MVVKSATSRQSLKCTSDCLAEYKTEANRKLAGALFLLVGSQTTLEQASVYATVCVSVPVSAQRSPLVRVCCWR